MKTNPSECKTGDVDNPITGNPTSSDEQGLFDAGAVNGESNHSAHVVDEEVEEILTVITGEYFGLVQKLLGEGYLDHPVITHMKGFNDWYSEVTGETEVPPDEYFSDVRKQLLDGVMVSPRIEKLKDLIQQYCNLPESLFERLDVLTLRSSAEGDGEDFDYKYELRKIAVGESYEKALVVATTTENTEAIACFLGLLYLHELDTRKDNRPWELRRKLIMSLNNPELRMNLRMHYHIREKLEEDISNRVTEYLRNVGCDERNGSTSELIAALMKRCLPSEFFDPDRVIAWQNEQRSSLPHPR